MKVILFGASGMVGQGVLRECLLDADVEGILSIGRTATGQRHPKLRELVHADLTDYSSVRSQLSGYDACFFCLGVSAAGMTEEAYHRVTYDIALAAAQALVKLNPGMTFIYVSGAGTDATEKGSVMWARVKGKTENALLRLPFKGVYVFRPGIIQPLHGIKSKTTAYRVGYAVMGPFIPAMRALFPNAVTTTEEVGRSMLAVARRGSDERVLEMKDIRRLGG